MFSLFIVPLGRAVRNRSSERAHGSPYGEQSASGLLLLDALGARLLARNFPFRIGLNASALFIGFREASLSLRDYLAVWEACLVLPAFAVGHAGYMASARLIHESCALISGRLTGN
jgi:hypothetical protein